MTNSMQEEFLRISGTSHQILGNQGLFIRNSYFSIYADTELPPQQVFHLEQGVHKCFTEGGGPTLVHCLLCNTSTVVAKSQLSSLFDI